jgi:PEGA domain
MNMRLGLIGCTVVGLLAAGGCVERTLSVASDPPGALVFLNDQEVGRTPLQHDFTWYGKYDVILRKDGYESAKTSASVEPPIYELPPLDLLVDLLPFRIVDCHSIEFTMRLYSATSDDSQGLVQRAQTMRGELESSRVAGPTTQPH